MKKIMPILLAFIVFALPFGGLKASAYSGGLLDGKSMTLGNDVGVGTKTTSGLTDGNLTNIVQLSAFGSDTNVVWYKFSSPVILDGARFKGSSTPKVRLYDSSKVLLYTVPVSGNDTLYNFTAVPNVSYVSLENLNPSTAINLNEFDVFGTTPPDTTPPYNVTNLSATDINENSFNVSWSKPSDTDLAGFKVYLNNSLVQTTSSTSYSFTGLSPSTQYDVKVTAYDTSGNENTGSIITVKTNDSPDTTPPANVTNLTGTPTYNSVSLSWINPPDSDFAKVKIYEDGVYKKTVSAPETTALFNNLEPEIEYTFKVTSVDYTGNESTGSSISIRTLPLPELKDIKNLKADSKYDRVKLSWQLPDSEYFHHVKIYRKVIQDKSFLDKIFGFASTTVYAADTTDGYSPMFETNGTYWTDLTVTPETNYEYKLTSVNTDDRESQGAVIDTTTPKEPKPTIEGAAFSKNPTGDYAVSWDSPTTGKVKIFVGGQLYKEVDAGQKGYTIPKDSMKNTVLGDPDVKLQPVGVFGTNGDMKRVPGSIDQTKIPFTVKDLIDSGNGLLWLLGPFILLALSFLLVPKFRRLVFSAFSKKGKEPKGNESERRFQPDEKEKRVSREREERLKTEIKEPRIRTAKEPRIRHKREPKNSSLTINKTQRIKREGRQLREPRERNRVQRMPRTPRIRGENRYE